MTPGGEAAPESRLAVEAERLEIGYVHEPVVRDLNFAVRPGESLALIGVNGSGKSTLLKTLVGLLPARAGRLSVLGARPGGAPRRIAYLSQFHSSGSVLPLRAVETVRMGRYANRGLLGRMTREDDDLVWQAMERMGVTALANQPLGGLSGGQQQRVYLAQVLARRADLLVLDEPAAGLDAGGRELYQRAVQVELARGAAVVLATHDLPEAVQCHQAMLLARRVVALGRGQAILTPEALLEAFGIVISLDPQQRGLAVMEREHCSGCDDDAPAGRF